MHRLLERRLSQREAASMLGLSVRQTERLLAGYRLHGTVDPTFPMLFDNPCRRGRAASITKRNP